MLIISLYLDCRKNNIKIRLLLDHLEQEAIIYNNIEFMNDNKCQISDIQVTTIS